MIYTRFGSPVKIVDASNRTIYVERLPGEIRHHEKRPVKTKGIIEPVSMWFVRAQYAEDLADGSAKAGDWVCGGGYVNAAELRADGGWGEIEDECLKPEINITGARELLAAM